MNKATDYARFSQEMVKLNIGTGNRMEMSDLVVGIYFDDLDDFDIEQVVRALRRCRLYGSGWFPAVAEVRQVIHKHYEWKESAPALPAPKIAGGHEPGECPEDTPRLADQFIGMSERIERERRARAVVPEQQRVNIIFRVEGESK
jgi:hypothetical protein